jgi:hypothetical protein
VPFLHPRPLDPIQPPTGSCGARGGCVPKICHSRPMRRRLLLVLCVLAMLAFASVAAGSGAGAKYKLKLEGIVASCNTSCPAADIGSIVIRRLDDDRTSCRPFVDFFSCKWTARAGTKVVLETMADPPYDQHSWGGDCSGTDKCKLIMDANKTFTLTWSAP